MSDIELNSNQDQPKAAIIAPLGNKEKNPKEGLKRRSILSRIISATPGILIGAGVMYGVKTAALATAAAFSAPAALALAGAAATVGLTAGGISYYKERKVAKNTGSSAPDFWTSNRLKTMGFHSAMTVLGGLLFTAIDGMLFEPDAPTDPLINDNNLPGIEPSTGDDTLSEITDDNTTQSPTNDDTQIDVTEDKISDEQNLTQESDPEDNLSELSNDVSETDTAIIPPVLSAFEQAQNSLAGNDCITDRVKEALVRAENGSAQGIKDIAYFMFNGFDCVTQNQEMAVDLFKQAADMGNVQAQVDLAYIQYHGLAGVEANTAEAFDKMTELATQDNRASRFISQWSR